MFERVWRIVVKEFIQIRRDPKMLVVMLSAPVMQMLVFGYAATTDVRHAATAVYDLDQSIASRELVARFVQSGYFDVVARVNDEAQARSLVDRGEAAIVLRMNKGFAEHLAAGRPAELQLIVDGTDSNSAGIVLDYANKIAWEFSRGILVRRYAALAGPGRLPAQVDLQTRAWFNENLESRNYFLPGVVAMIVTLTTLILTSMAVVREKEIGTIEQILVTPITPLEFMLGKTIPFALVGLADVALVASVAVFWFGVPIRGSLAFIFFATSVYLMTTLGTGLLISTISRTQQQALMSSMLFYFPLVFLSGFAFPVSNMPQVVQWLSAINPLRHFLVVLRGIFLKGVGIETLWPQLLLLTVMGAAILRLASLRFRKTLT